MKLCSRLLMVFGRNLGKKWQIWVYESHFGEVRGDTRPWLIARWKAHGRLYIALGNFIHYPLWLHSYEAKCLQLGCFHRGSTSLHSNFTRTGSSPDNYSWRQKTRDTGLRKGEDCIPLRSLDDTIPECDGQTDGQRDLPEHKQHLQR